MFFSDARRGFAMAGDYRVKYGLTVLAIAVLFLALVGYQMYATLLTAQSAAAVNAQNLALVLESKLNNDFAAAERTVAFMAAEVRPVAMHAGTVGKYRPEISRLLKSHVHDISSAAALRYVDANGNWLYSSADGDPEMNIAERPFFQQLKGGSSSATVFSEIALGRVSGRVLMWVAKAVRNPDGSFPGAAITSIDLTALREYFHEIELGEGGTVSLRRIENGAVVARFPGPIEVDNKPNPDLPVRQAILNNGPNGAIEITSRIDGVQRVYGYRAIGEFPFFIAVGIAETEYLRTWHENLVASLLGSLLFLAVLGWVFFQLAKAESRRNRSDSELRQSEERLRLAMDASNQAWFDLELQTGKVVVSPEYPHMIGYEAGEFHSDLQNWLANVHLDDRQGLEATMRSCIADGGPQTMEYRRRTKSGDWKWIRSIGKVVQRDANQQATRMIGIHTDITERKKAQLALMESEAYSKALFVNSDTPLVIMDPNTGTFIDCNEAAVGIYHLGDRKDVLGMTPLDVSAPMQYDGTPSAEAAQFHVAAARTAGVHVFEWRHQRPNGEIWDAEVHLMNFRHGGRDLMQFSMRDITQQKRTEADSWRRANFDALTGLTNRSLCRDRLERALAQAQRSGDKVGVLFLDLDGFKGINDTLGHALGDDMLIEAARRLERCVREQDTVARFGGDEFVVVAQNLGQRIDLTRIAEQILSTMRQPFSLAGTTQRITCSVGISVFPDDADVADTLIDHADQAMYVAKRKGKDQSRFFAEDGAG